MSTDGKERSLANLVKWKPGQSGNPKGRITGSKDALNEAFLRALLKDFHEHGAAAIATCRETKPEAYIAAISRLLPKDMNVNVDAGAVFLNLLEVITHGLDRGLAQEQGQPKALCDGRPAGHA
jgi:hypothetical protein